MYSDYWKQRIERYRETVKELKLQRDMMQPSAERDIVKKKLEITLTDIRNIEEHLANESQKQTL